MIKRILAVTNLMMLALALAVPAMSADKPKEVQLSPVTAFKDGFTLEQSKKFRNERDLAAWLGGGDASVWVNLRPSEAFPATALALNRKIKARGFFRSVFFYPVLLSPIVVALIWKWILQENGLFNGILTGLGFDKVPFMVDAGWARLWVVIIRVWATMGFYTLILLAGLQAIPPDVYEAADIDGANNWQMFWGITLPLLMPNMVVVLVLSLIRAVQVFDVVFAFTGGGPGTATQYLVQYIYDKGFSSPSRQFGLAAAASLLMAGVLVVLTLGQQLLQREEA